MTGSSETIANFRRSGSDIEVRHTVVTIAFGQEIALAERVVQLPLMKVAQTERLPGVRDAWKITLVPLAAEEIEVFAEYRPLPADRREAEERRRAQAE
jgi:hypothetical protein